ncbi:hypothetical protein BKA70DRAFT_1276543 [Coprinopsis sp. MPI-PUGE-AT-0042]|nr:hypothetical protein BKA70DRAFT_1312675 [Coprinopsis sp. MPI-PUGE-AT-0042]KAH6909570.1 hypothetical protein BKA70DRAFT_1276543 [Coprinopsis sp. MPI-PUGE-AT-0042]
MPYRAGKGGAPRSNGRNSQAFARARDTTTNGGGPRPHLRVCCLHCHCNTEVKTHSQHLQGVTNTGGDISVAGRDVVTHVITNYSLIGPISIQGEGMNTTIYCFFVDAGHSILTLSILTNPRGALPLLRCYQCEEWMVLDDCVAFAVQKNCSFNFISIVMKAWITPLPGGNLATGCSVMFSEGMQPVAWFIPDGDSGGRLMYKAKAVAAPCVVVQLV